jgi:hypothetical protein
MADLRRAAYLISALAVACFFLVPEPDTAIIGALLLQTLAFVVIAGKSAADGIVLTGITVLLIGLIPADHPLVREPFFITVKPWFVAIGIAVIVFGLLLIGSHARD